MIIGRGDIASALTDRSNRIYFASGVSNSKETVESEYQREVKLLVDTRQNYPLMRLVYFGSLSIFYDYGRYQKHKRWMEGLVKALFPEYTILRMGNITWGTNSHTLINYLRARIANGEPVEVRDEYRYIVSKDEFLHWINMIPEWNCEMNVVGRMMKVKDIIREYCMPENREIPRKENRWPRYLS